MHPYLSYARIKQGLSWRFSRLQFRVNPYISKMLGYMALVCLWIRKSLPHRNRHHGQAEKIIISLTSYPPRFETLPYTLQCLCLQSVAPDRIILWIEQKDADSLPEQVKAFTERGVEIRYYKSLNKIPDSQDIGSYRKLIPALEQFPDACIVLADDDCYYGAAWLKQLVRTWIKDKTSIAYHRANRVRRDEEGRLYPYYKWHFNVKAPQPDADTWISSGPGTLIPPRSLHADVLDHPLFMTLSPRSDETWLHWMIHRNGTPICKTAYRFYFINWPDTQNSALCIENVLEGRKDKQITAMINHFGWPSAEQARLYG